MYIYTMAMHSNRDVIETDINVIIAQDLFGHDTRSGLVLCCLQQEPNYL